MILAAVLLFPAQRTQAATLASVPGAVTTASGSLNVRSSPSTGAPVVASLPKGSHITLMERSGSWWRVEFGKNQFGYCSASYITPISGTAVQVATASGSLNVRSGPGTGYAKTGSLPKGETVIRLSTANGWSRILYHGTKTGYVSAAYLSGGYGSVTLNVPDYKQTDSRWANVTLGSSGKPMSQIGCATTAIAMVESHRRGYRVTPDAMARELRYTPSGSVYWPEHYTTVTNETGYLTKIHTLLRQGKSVLLGARNDHGSQHWVVIYGFRGGELTPSNFLIRDPGSRSRTTLQHFLAAYPNFYKYFHA